MSRLGISIATSNALLDIAGWFEDHGHLTAYRRLVAFRGRFDKAMCRVLLGHPRIIYGAMCDICLDCLSIVDEHPNGRGRSDSTTGDERG